MLVEDGFAVLADDHDDVIEPATRRAGPRSSRSCEQFVEIQGRLTEPIVASAHDPTLDVALDRAGRVFAALADPTRRTIVR